MERDIFCVGDECIVYQMRITESKEEVSKNTRQLASCLHCNKKKFFFHRRYQTSLRRTSKTKNDGKESWNPISQA